MDFGSLELAFEEDVLNNPYSLKSWWRFLDFKKDARPKERKKVYERALRSIPGSYKLWFHYLQERIAIVKKKKKYRYKSEEFHKKYQISCENVNNVFERSLVFMHKMPKIWLMYCNFLSEQNNITRTRHTFDRALKSLPITQHDQIWEIYLKFARNCKVPETTVRVFRRYLQLEPHRVEDFLEYLLSVDYVQEATEILLQICGDQEFVSTKDKSRLELWMELCQLISRNARKIQNLDVDSVIRFGIRKFTDCVGRLWTALAEYYIRLRQFEKARDIFEEAMGSVKTVRDFTLIWEAYTVFLEGLLGADMDSKSPDISEEEWNADLDLLLLRYESLIERRPLLLSSVLLRQNPHNVDEWERRSQIYSDPKDIKKKLEVFSEAIATVDPMKATGKPHRLWIGYAMVYERSGNLKYARQILQQAVSVNFKNVGHLSSVWLYYAEMEIRHKNYDRAREILKKATEVPIRQLHHYKKVSCQNLIHKSLPLWLLKADLEESFGSYDSTCEVYEGMMDLKIITPEVLLNFANYCEENDRYEESFRAFERGVNLFQFPYSQQLWEQYLKKFIDRYEAENIERTRDLFEQVLEHAPSDCSHIFYLMYAHFEEKHGLARRAMYVYERATKNVSNESRKLIFTIYIARARELFGVTKTREIYEKAIDMLEPKHIPEMCLKYGNLETIVGEVDRARSIYTHGSQYCDPRAQRLYWKKWHDFEVRHGNEDTFSEMMRIKRSVQAQYNTQVNLGLDVSNPIVDEVAALEAATAPGKRGVDRMQALEMALKTDENIERPGNPPPAKRARTDGTIGHPMPVPPPSSSNVVNPDEISLEVDGEDDDDDDEESEENEKEGKVELEQLSVPKEVFGGMLKEK